MKNLYLRGLIPFVLGFLLVTAWAVNSYAEPQAPAEWTHDGINTTAYDLQYSKDITFLGATTLTFPANQRSTVVEGLDWDQIYYFKLVAKGPGGDTESDVVSATTPPEPVGPPSKPVLKIQITSTAADGTVTTWTLAAVEAD